MQKTIDGLTLGEFRVKTEFNPSKNDTVSKIKQKTAELINLCLELKESQYDDLKQSIFEENCDWAAKLYEEAGMWAVKAATFK